MDEILRFKEGKMMKTFRNKTAGFESQPCDRNLGAKDRK